MKRIKTQTKSGARRKSVDAPLVAVFPGSFDPFTLGHLDLVERALEHFDLIYISVLENRSKKGLFDIEYRMELIRESCRHLGKGVEVTSFGGLLVEHADSLNVRVILRGLRAISDYDYEAQLALVNKGLSPKIETFFLMSREQFSYVSSSLVRQIAQYGGDVKHLVPDNIASALRQIFPKKGRKSVPQEL